MMSDQAQDNKEWDNVLRQAWVNTSLERDKAIITLSSAGLALIVAFITSQPAHDCLMRTFLLVGMAGFTASAIAGVRCLHINRDIISRELDREPELNHHFSDTILIAGFIVGIVSVFLLGLTSIVAS